MEFYILHEKDYFVKSDYFINDSWSLSDPFIGSNCKICTGTDCLGHFGLLDLGDYYLNPLFEREYKKYIKVLCASCNVLCKDEKSICSVCNMYVRHPLNYIDISSKFVTRYLLVPPSSIRSSEDLEWKTELFYHYNNLLHSVKNKWVSRIKENLEKILSPSSSSGLVDLLSGKDGVIRKTCYGKRIEGSARSVITCDTSIEIDQVHVPKIIADNLYTERVLDGSEVDVSNMYIEKGLPLEKWHVFKGLKVLCKLSNDDIVVMNRQPTLSYQSMLSFRVKVREDDIKTIGIHPSVTQTFNADFDGDEMNLFVFPQNSDVKDLLITNFPECIRKIQDEKTSEYLGLNSYEELDRYGLTVKLSDIARKNVENTSLEIMMKSGAKGSSKNLEQMMNCIGDQYVYGKRVGHIANSYYSGMDPEEYFIHQMASREGIVVQGVTTSDTGYLNRKGCHVFADVVKYPNGVVRDNYGVLRF